MIALPIVTEFLRTDEACFAQVPDFPYTPRYTVVGGLRIAHIDEGPPDAPVVLLMHGEPTWSFLYRKMIPVLLAAGCRVVLRLTSWALAALTNRPGRATTRT